ncbi:interleukin-5 receptor subunit alpha-like isoform X1 [Corvus hawaiiensis]|uniref:interleukin-5 receptor subunit alpha-like isoform X1 n=2 Tax=Corvus hawaiiensis TaxID=134902 RepID=UPI00201A1372|nr:interleukin-5 receptor subunit alpha-like isoform X1 [Corvus hawaiiensis]XP_048180145.1 interleukin-5 receptor subunit alpha-like isoform X1 [Corvus hawaiiensis]XP_048180147.1 interleukin-5 receptor subunit alpha-like isoform X1 [Corvus hawaiiensis]XP_048180150.1 interleukin-5 receptor subunit alpha-like isoform X1 [Corvus hawaiiensis]
MARVTVIPVLLILSFFQHKALFSTILASGQQDIKDALGLHNVLWMTKNDSRVILSWNNNLTKEETKKYTVKYILIYKFFNTTKERKERLQEKEKIIHLKLHSGFNAKVKTQLFAKETEDIIKESDWTEFTYEAPPVYIQNLSCIIYNISFFNCTWHIKAEAPEDIQIFTSYRHAGKVFACHQYIKNAWKKNIGCYMKKMHFQPSRKINLNITVRNLRNSSRGLSYCKAFTPQTIEKLNPPINVSVSLENRNIKIHWKPPPTIGSARKKCFLYQVKIADHKIVNVTAENYKYPFHKPAKKCAVQVRVKKEICIANKIWSEWSKPVFIHDEKTVDILLLSLALFCPLIFLGGLLIYACRRYRCLEVITTPVPHPSDNIKTWLADETHHEQHMSMQMEMHSEFTLGRPEENRDENIQLQKCLKEFVLEDLQR